MAGGPWPTAGCRIPTLEQRMESLETLALGEHVPAGDANLERPDPSTRARSLNPGDFEKSTSPLIFRVPRRSPGWLCPW